MEQAKLTGRVVQRLRQLEVEGGSLEGRPTQGEIARRSGDNDEEGEKTSSGTPPLM